MAESDDYKACPYDKSHIVKIARLPYHLEKCRRNYQVAKKPMKACVYDSSHEIAEPEYQQHLEICPSRHASYQVMANIAEYEQFQRSRAELPYLQCNTGVVDHDDEENWDTYATGGYNCNRIPKVVTKDFSFVPASSTAYMAPAAKKKIHKDGIEKFKLSQKRSLIKDDPDGDYDDKEKVSYYSAAFTSDTLKEEPIIKSEPVASSKSRIKQEVEDNRYKSKGGFPSRSNPSRDPRLSARPTTRIDSAPVPGGFGRGISTVDDTKPILIGSEAGFRQVPVKSVKIGAIFSNLPQSQ